jgi:hypothetical protein
LNWKLNTAKYVVHWYEAGKHNKGNPKFLVRQRTVHVLQRELYAHKSWLDEFSHTAQQYLAQAGIIGSQMTPIPVPNPKAGVPNQPPMVQIPAVPVNIEVANKQLKRVCSFSRENVIGRLHASRHCLPVIGRTRTLIKLA